MAMCLATGQQLPPYLYHTILHLVDSLLCQVGHLTLQVVDDNLEVLLLQLLLLDGIHYPLLVLSTTQLSQVRKELLLERACDTKYMN